MRKFTKNILRQKKYIALGLLGILLTIGGTYALGTHKMNLKNEVQSAAVSGEIQEEFPEHEIQWDGSNTKKVSISNTGNAYVFVRMSYSDYWKYTDDNGDVTMLPSAADQTATAEKIWTDAWKTEWQDGQDGWFYYKKLLPPGESTADILTGVEFYKTEDERYEQSDYKLLFQMEMVQASSEISVSHDAVKTLFKNDFTPEAESDWTNTMAKQTITWKNVSE